LLSRESESGSNVHSLARKQTALVNRVQEMMFLKDSADKATRGEGGVVFIYGEAGIGKTRLTKEIKAHANLRGMRILYGRCPALFKATGVPPYTLWKEVIKDYLQGCTPEELQRVVGYYPGEISKIIPEIKQKLIVFSESPVLSPDLERDRLFEAVSQFVTNISKTAPLIVVLDDLQWADPSSLLLLHYLARGIYRENLLFLGAYRDTEIEVKHPLFPVLTDLNRARLLQCAQLKRFSYSEVSQMVKQILGIVEVPNEFCERIYEKTDGNPFFIEEVLTSLKEEGVIYCKENECKIREFSKIEFPRTVKDVLKERIERLDKECQELLLTASFIGNDFTFEALREITGIEDEKLLEKTENILKTGLLRCKVSHGEELCSFADTLIRDVLCEEVSPLRSRKLHQDIALALERTYERKKEEHYGELATHFLEGGEKDKAFDYFLKAGEKAKKVYANNEAASYFRTALKLAQEKNSVSETRIRILEELGDVEELLGEHGNCLESWNEILCLLDQSQEKNKAARIHRKIAKILWSKLGCTEKAEKHQDQALEILKTESESLELSSLTADMARMYFRAGDMDKAAPLGQKALEISLKMNDCDAISSSYITLGALFYLQGDSNKATSYLEEALKISINQGCLENAVYAYDNLGFTLERTNEKEKRLDYYQKGLDLAKKIGAISAQSWIGNNLSDMLIGMGNINDALQMKEESIAIDRKTGNLVNLTLALAALGHLYQILGNWTECEKCLDEARSLSQKINDIPASGFAQLAMVSFYIEKGEYTKPKEILQSAYELAAKSGAKFLQITMNDFLIHILIKSGDIAEGEKKIDEQYKLARELNDKEHIAYTHGLKAMLLCKQKKWNESIEYFQKGLEELDAINAKRWNVYEYAKRILFEYSKVYLERRYEGDNQRALAILNQTLEIFQKLNAKNDVEKVKKAIDSIEKSQQTNIEIEPASHTPTGFTKLDYLLAGGIPPTYAVALTSPSCDEKDTLIKSFLENGAKNGEITFYVTTEHTFAMDLAVKYPSNFYIFICNPQAENVIKKALNIFFLKGVESLTELNIAITQAIRNINSSANTSRRICLNIISDVLLEHHSVQTRKWLTELITLLKSKGFTTLSIIDPQVHPSEELYAILGIFDGEINIRQIETDNGSATFLKIKRMRHREYSKNEEHITGSQI
jgi:predicted ATPase/KaiC/GvpD/RAD55 family RecA-like ATPase